MTTALLVVDVQQALCTGEEAAADIDAVIERINALIARARAEGVPIVFIQHEDVAGSLELDSAGWQLAAGLHARTEDLRVRKTRPNSFDGTDLGALLKDHGVSRVVVCGLQTDHCVDGTVRGALALGYDVVLAADAHSTVDSAERAAAEIRAEHNATLAGLAAVGQRIAVMPAAVLRVAS
jgi:nicotinamidase-related amidase